MSAGPFTNTKYETDEGDIQPIRVAPATLAANLGSANTAPTGELTINRFVKVSKNNRAIGTGPRTVSLKFTATVPSGYAANSIVTIPVMTPAVWQPLNTLTTGTYLGVAVRVVGKSRESIR